MEDEESDVNLGMIAENDKIDIERKLRISAFINLISSWDDKKSSIEAM